MATSPLSPAPTETHSLPSLIWLVDDDAAFSSLATEVAERVGVSLVVKSREDAAECQSHSLPDRVIVDGELFRLSSSRALARTSTLPRYLEYAGRVLVCTAYRDDDLDATRMRDPRIRLLRKPFDLGDFEAALVWLGSGATGRRAAHDNLRELRAGPLSLGAPRRAPRTSATAAGE